MRKNIFHSLQVELAVVINIRQHCVFLFWVYKWLEPSTQSINNYKKKAYFSPFGQVLKIHECQTSKKTSLTVGILYNSD